MRPSPVNRPQLKSSISRMIGENDERYSTIGHLLGDVVERAGEDLLGDRVERSGAIIGSRCSTIVPAAPTRPLQPARDDHRGVLLLDDRLRRATRRRAPSASRVLIAPLRSRSRRARRAAGRRPPAAPVRPAPPSRSPAMRRRDAHAQRHDLGLGDRGRVVVGARCSSANGRLGGRDRRGRRPAAARTAPSGCRPGRGSACRASAVDDLAAAPAPTRRAVRRLASRARRARRRGLRASTSTPSARSQLRRSRAGCRMASRPERGGDARVARHEHARDAELVGERRRRASARRRRSRRARSGAGRGRGRPTPAAARAPSLALAIAQDRGGGLPRRRRRAARRRRADRGLARGSRVERDAAGRAALGPSVPSTTWASVTVASSPPRP